MSSPISLTAFEELYLEFQRKVSSEWHKRLDRLVSGSQAGILWSLHYEGPQSASKLAAGLGITPGAVTSLSDKLISSGYAIRKKDEQDRRVVYLEITPEGRVALEQFRHEMKKIIDKFFAGVSQQDLEHLIRIFRQVLLNIEQMKRGDTSTW